MKCKISITMKTKFIYLALLGLCALSACEKKVTTDRDSLSETLEYCELQVSASCASILKSTGTDVSKNEKLIKKLQVFVFRGDLLDAYVNVSSSTAKLTCTAGEREVYAVVNGPDLASISSKSALKAFMVDLANNSTDSLVMCGLISVILPKAEAVTIPVNRIVSRIVIKKISRDFESKALSSLPFVIKRIYVSDAAGNINLECTTSPTKWYNSGDKKDELPTLLSDKDLSIGIENGSSYNTSHYYYTLPHNAGVKKTKIVIEATLDNTTYYYPLELPAMERNKSYEFQNIVIKRPGADEPTDPVVSESISFNVEVVDWTIVPIEEKII